MQRLILSFLLVMFITCGAYGIDIEEINIVPPSPTPSDAITLEVAGTFDHSLAQSIQRAPWQRLDNEIQIDLLMFELPLKAPSIAGPFEQEVDLGYLSIGEYEVTARTFVTLGLFPDPSPFPDPWLFPDEFNGAGPVDTMKYRFEVIPEPAAITLFSLGGMTVLCYRRVAYRLV